MNEQEISIIAGCLFVGWTVLIYRAGYNSAMALMASFVREELEDEEEEKK